MYKAIGEAMLSGGTDVEGSRDSSTLLAQGLYGLIQEEYWVEDIDSSYQSVECSDGFVL